MKKNLPYIVIIATVLIAGIFLVKSGNDQRQARTTSNSSWGQKSATTDTHQETSQEAASENYVSGINLVISQPQPNATVTSPNLSVRGKTSPSAEVFVNDVELKADDAGNFNATIILDEGENPIIVVVNDLDGNSAENQLLVTYTPQE